MHDAAKYQSDTRDQLRQPHAADAGHAALARQVQTYLHTAPTSEFQGQSPTVTRQWQGRDNMLWQVYSSGRTAVVKLFLDAGQARGRRQFDGQAVFAPLGIAPHPLWFDRYPHGLARQVLVYTWVEGTSLDNLPRDALGNALLTDLAAAIAAVHTGPLDQVRRFCPHPINLGIFWRVETDALQNAVAALRSLQALSLCRIVEGLAAHVDAAAQRAIPLWDGAPPTPVHGDLLPDNCLVQRGGAPLLLDWEQYGMGDPALDIARFFFHMQQPRGSADFARFLDTYLSHVDQPGLAARIEAYGRVLPAQALAFLLNGVHRVALKEAPAAKEEHIALLADLPFIAEVVHAALLHAAEQAGLNPDWPDPATAVQAWSREIAGRVRMTRSTG